MRKAADALLADALPQVQQKLGIALQGLFHRRGRLDHQIYIASARLVVHARAEQNHAAAGAKAAPCGLDDLLVLEF